jgi:hypothetical protein
MNWNLILTSSIIATILSSLVNLLIWGYQKKHEFKYDYKKYILDKRKHTYNWIEEILTYSSPIHKISDHIAHKPFQDYPSLMKLIDLTSKNSASQMWLSNALLNCLTSLNHLASEAANTPENPSIIKFGIEKFDIIKDILIRMRIEYFKDLMELDDIKKYRRSMKPQLASAIPSKKP